MSNQTYLASKRNGGRANMAPGRVRLSITISEGTFEALRARASAARRGLSGEAAAAIEQVLAQEASA